MSGHDARCTEPVEYDLTEATVRLATPRRCVIIVAGAQERQQGLALGRREHGEPLGECCPLVGGVVWWGLKGGLMSAGLNRVAFRVAARSDPRISR